MEPPKDTKEILEKYEKALEAAYNYIEMEYLLSDKQSTAASIQKQIEKALGYKPY